MAVVINGTTGITSVNGSAAAPSVTGTDTDTGIVYGTNTLSLATGGTTAVTVDSSQNVGFGNASPAAKVDAFRPTIGTYFLGGGGDNVARQLAFTSSTTTNSGDTHTLNAQSGTGVIAFAIANSERARLTIDTFTLNAARIFFNGASGVPAPTVNGEGAVGTYAAYGTCFIGRGSSYDIGFLNKNGNFAGYVATGATTITTSSDERLKENNQPITGALDIVCQMRHETGNYKSDPDRQVAFLIAQDVDALFPYAVEKTNPEEMGVNYNWIIPLHGAAITELTALVKEQQAIIEQLKADVAELKAAK